MKIFHFSGLCLSTSYLTELPLNYIQFTSQSVYNCLFFGHFLIFVHSNKYFKGYHLKKGKVVKKDNIY